MLPNMDFPRASLTTSRGMTYSYIYIPRPQTRTPTQMHSSSRTLLFLHGFPSLALDFHHQITQFLSLGYEVLAPDLIGYGNSSCPDLPEDYSHKLIVNDLIEILDRHSITTVVGIAHDFGAQILTRLNLYFSARVDKLIFLTIGPITPGQPFDLEAVNKMTKDMLGYEGYGYQEFLTQDPNATELMTEKNRSFHDLIFTSDHELWKDWFGRRGGLKKWLDEDRKSSVISGFSDDLQQAHLTAFSRQSGGHDSGQDNKPGENHQNGYEGAKHWYTAMINNLNIADDVKQIEHERGNQNQDQNDEYKYKIPPGKKILLLTAAKDVIALPEIQTQMTQSIMTDPESDLTTKQIDAGHWIMLEKANEVNSCIDEFLNRDSD